MRRATATVAVLTLALASCGGGGERSDEDLAREAAQGFMDDLVPGRYEKACDQLDVPFRRLLDQTGGCADAIATLPKVRSPHAENVKVQRDQATAEIRGKARKPIRLKLVRKDGQWRVSEMIA